MLAPWPKLLQHVIGLVEIIACNGLVQRVREPVASGVAQGGQDFLEETQGLGVVGGQQFAQTCEGGGVQGGVGLAVPGGGG